MPREGHDPKSQKQLRQERRISIHVPREGHDLSARSFSISSSVFLSTCPVRGTTGPVLPPHERRAISIHVPREGHDRQQARADTEAYRISIHVPREGHDEVTNVSNVIQFPFLSTCPVRGTTFFHFEFF